jgi:hypothetical protein
MQGDVDAGQRDVGDEEIHDRQERAGEQEEHTDGVQPAGQRNRARRGMPGLPGGEGDGRGFSNYL